MYQAVLRPPPAAPAPSLTQTPRLSRYDMSHQAGQGKNQTRRYGHTFDLAERDTGPGYKIIAGQDHESMSSCFPDQLRMLKNFASK